MSAPALRPYTQNVADALAVALDKQGVARKGIEQLLSTLQTLSTLLPAPNDVIILVGDRKKGIPYGAAFHYIRETPWGVSAVTLAVVGALEVTTDGQCALTVYLRRGGKQQSSWNAHTGAPVSDVQALGKKIEALRDGRPIRGALKRLLYRV